ncbi:MAG: hypothetical protein SF069_02210 [Phycisphaerae bacterium]|nr:hypothetical protein [Phycisphaerae bacterium]
MSPIPLRSALVVCAGAFAAWAAAQTHVYHHQVIHDPTAPALARAVDPMPDGTAVYVAEYSNPPMIPPPAARPLLVQFDPDLRPMRGVTFFRPGEFPGPAMTQLFVLPREQDIAPDASMILCGDFEERDPNGGLLLRGAFVMRLDPMFNVIWYREYPRVDSFFDITIMSPGIGLPIESIVCGYRRLSPQGPTYATVAGLDPMGNVLWARDVWSIKQGLQGDAEYRAIIRFNPEEAALVGSANMNRGTNDQYLADADLLVTRVRRDGVLVFNRVYGQYVAPGPDGALYGVVERGWSLDQIQNSGMLLITGQVAANPLTPFGAPWYEDVLAVRLDPLGLPMWSWRYDFAASFDFGRDIKVTGIEESHILADAYTPFFAPNFSPDLGLLHLDPGGIPLPPSDVFGGPRVDIAAELLRGGPPMPMPLEVMLLGSSDSFGPNYPVPYLLERFQRACYRCQSVELPVPPIPSPLEMIPAFDEAVPLVSDFRELLAIPVPLQPMTICKNCLVGDTNCDGFVTVGDISGFVLAITNPAAYLATYPNCCIETADVNCDGFVTVGDIAPFVQMLVGGP